MKTIKRIFPLIVVLTVLFAFIPIESFAVDPVSTIGFAAAMDAYGMSYGVGTTYDVANANGISDNFDVLWGEFSQYQINNNASLPTIDGQTYSYDQYIEEWQENYKAVKAEELTHSSGKFATFYIDEETASVFDNFWNWLLTGPAEMTRIDNEYFQFNQNQIGPDAFPIVISSINTSPWASCLCPFVSSSDNSVIYNKSLKVWTDSDNWEFHIANKTSSSTQLYVFYYVSGNSKNPVFVSPQSGTTYYCTYKKTDGSINSSFSGNTSLYSETYNLYYQNPFGLHFTNNFYVQSYSDLDSGLSSLSSFISDPSATSEDVGIKSYNPSGIVNIPNPYGQDYVPIARTIITNAPWDETYDDEDTDGDTGLAVPYPTNAIPDVIDDIADKMVDDGFAIEDDPQPDDPDPPPPAPSEVFYPLLPVAAPSFNFNLSGIWHYVRDWISSISSWFSLVFTMWDYLPYAIVVPVYATAVIVIVLGVYKRFFM